MSRVGHHLLLEAFPRIPFLYANEGSKLKAQYLEAGQGQSVIYFDFPDAEAVGIVARLKIPVVLVEEPFEHILVYAMAAWGMDLAAAIRFATRSLSLLHPVTRLPSVLRVTCDGKPLTLTVLAQMISHHTGTPLTSEALDRLVAAMDPQALRNVDDIVVATMDHPTKARRMLNALTADERRLVQEVGAGYGALAQGEAAPTFVWPRQILLRAGDAKPTEEAIPLIGPARILSYGPYLHLPVGTWHAEMRFQIEGSLSRNALIMEVTAGAALLASGQAELPSSGAYSMRMTFSVTDPAVPIEVRSVLATGAIEGHLRPLEILVHADAKTGEAETSRYTR